MRLATLLGGAILVGSGIVAAVPAQAALSDCPADYTCIWVNNDFTGGRAQRAHGNSAIWNLDGSMNDRMDSWANRSATYGSCGWALFNGQGSSQEWDATDNDDNVGPLNSDVLSSWRTRGGC